MVSNLNFLLVGSSRLHWAKYSQNQSKFFHTQKDQKVPDNIDLDQLIWASVGKLPNFLLKENVVLKWVHRFGIDSLNDLLIHSSLQKENQLEEENQEQISLIDEVHEENQEQIKLELSKTFGNIEETNLESNGLENASSNQIFSKNQNSNKINQFTENPKLPLPNIKNLRKWINKDKKAS